MVRFMPMLGNERASHDESEMLCPYRNSEGVEGGCFPDWRAEGRHHMVVKHPKSASWNLSF